MWHFRLVQGKSMLPTYRPGQTVLVSNSRSVRVGDVVVAFQNGREVLKRVTGLQDGQVFLEGDNSAHSTDSRHHGWLVDRHLVGKVIWPKKRKKQNL